MAGKSKHRDSGRANPSRPTTPATPTTPSGLLDGPFKGHLGVKSSPFAPTDSKLISQYMVLDHMTAHYRKLNKAKACVDTTPPKAWLVSQKVRDRVRRESLQQESRRRQAWLSRSQSPFGSPMPPGGYGAESVASSDADRDEMIAMMRSMDVDGYDEIDGRDIRDARLVSEGNTTIAANPSDSSSVKPIDKRDMTFVDKIVQDSTNAPSHYHSPKPMKSNIPRESKSRYGSNRGAGKTVHSSLVQDRPVQRSQAALVSSSMPHSIGGAYGTNKTPTTPRSKDLLDTQAHKFTDEKPFQPRTLRKTTTQSKLSEFKYYNPPKKRSPQSNGIEDEPHQGSVTHSGGNNGHARNFREPRGSVISRPDTESVDWANETLMSRDMPQNRHSSGVPPLDISLDADHIHWLKEQSKKAQLRASYTNRSRSDAASDVGSLRSRREGSVNGEPRGTMRGTAMLNGTGGAGGMTTRYPRSNTMYRVETEEEELKYLEFISDVTNDVLDRGIYTNRVLMQVFDSHIEKRKHDLRVSKMREMLEELRVDLGIPAAGVVDGEDLGLSSTRAWSPEDLNQQTQGFDSMDSGIQGSTVDRRGTLMSDSRGSRRRNRSPTHGANLPNLRGSHRRGGEGKPPLPSGYRGGHRSRPGSAASSLANTEIREEREEMDSFHEMPADNFGTMTMKHGQASTMMPTKADILTIHHEEEDEQEEELEEAADEVQARDAPQVHATPLSLTTSAAAASETASEAAASDNYNEDETDGKVEKTEEVTAFSAPVDNAEQQEDSSFMSPATEDYQSSQRHQEDVQNYDDDPKGSTTTSLKDEEDLTMKYEDALRDDAYEDYEDEHQEHLSEQGEAASVKSIHSSYSRQTNPEESGTPHHAPETDGMDGHEEGVPSQTHEDDHDRHSFTSSHQDAQHPEDDQKDLGDLTSASEDNESTLRGSPRDEGTSFLEQTRDDQSFKDEDNKSNLSGHLSGHLSGLNSPVQQEENKVDILKLDDSPRTEDPPKPTPRKRGSRTPRSEAKETPRSQEMSHTSESVTVSELDEDEYGGF